MAGLGAPSFTTTPMPTEARLILLPAATLPPAIISSTTAGAFKQVVLALVPDYERQTGNHVTVDNGTTGQLTGRIAGGKVAAGSKINLASVGIGVVVKEGAPKPAIGTVDQFKEALLKAKTVAYIDPASGGSSGIYVDKLLEKLGIADQIRPKAKLKKGGYVAELIASGEAELGIHQISEIVPVKGVTLVGPLPKEIQNTTTYAAGLSTSTKEKDAAKELIEYLSGADAAAVLKSKGMVPAK